MRIGLALSVVLTLGGAARADDLIARGEYLARAGDCIACHSKPGGEPFAGGAAVETPYGAIYPPNITPDKQTGIGAWSDDDFYRAMHEGLDREGHYLYPVFPFPWYANVSRDDALAIKAYLFSLNPAHAANKPPAFRFPYDIRATLGVWRALFFKPGEDKPAPAEAETVERGRYLVEGLGHCGECHNHDATFGASDWSGRYRGGAVQGWYAPNITSDGRQGVGAWSVEEIATYLKTGAAPGKGVALGPMQETIDDSLSQLTDVDRRAIAAYLKSIPATQTFANDAGGYAKNGAPGQNLYVDHCAACHGLDGQGAAGRVPPLAHNGAVNAEGPENVIRVVLGGLSPAHGLGPMPAVGAALSDEDVARLSDYVRNRFGNAAPATSDPTQVAKLRAATHTPMAPASAQDCGASAAPQTEIEPILDVKSPEQPVAVDALLQTLKPALAKSPDAPLVDLTAAYCRASFEKAPTSPADRAAEIGQFAVLLYSRARAALAE